MLIKIVYYNFVLQNTAVCYYSKPGKAFPSPQEDQSRAACPYLTHTTERALRWWQLLLFIEYLLSIMEIRVVNSWVQMCFRELCCIFVLPMGQLNLLMIVRNKTHSYFSNHTTCVPTYFFNREYTFMAET